MAVVERRTRRSGVSLPACPSRNSHLGFQDKAGALSHTCIDCRNTPALPSVKIDRMPFCSQCGKPVGQSDVFCHACGAKQPQEAPSAAHSIANDPLAGITPRTASILCYIPVVGWIAAIIVLASQKYRHVRPVRFHAFQALYLFVAWLINDNVLRWVFTPIAHFHFQDLIRVVLLGMSIFMMVKASRDEEYSLPLFGELAQRSVSEG